MMKWEITDTEQQQLRLTLLLMAERLTVANLQYKTPVQPENANAVLLFKNWYETAHELLMKEEKDETTQ